METWIPLTIFAAFSQNIRSALQKRLTGVLSPVGATQVRFLYAIPFAVIYFIVLCRFLNYSPPVINKLFVVYACIGGLCQILATALLLTLFTKRNFFIGTAYSKTETIQTALFGLVLLSDRLTIGAVLGIMMGVLGIIIISSTKSQFSMIEIFRSLKTRTALIGMLSGLFFGLTSVCYRAASLTLEGGFVIQAAFTLVFVLFFQTFITSVYLILREPKQITAVLRSWKISWLVGLSGMAASVGWFTAMTIENAAHVRALGQVELIFTFAASVLFFKEKTTRLELLGVGSVTIGIIILLLYR